MSLKEKMLGFILILVGVIPLLSKIESMNAYFSTGFFSYLNPGSAIYQIILILIGILLIWSMKPKQRMQRY
jgi:hypothetical protein